MSDTPRTALTPLPEPPAEFELSALVAIYCRAIERYEEANAAEGSGGEDSGKEVSNVPATPIIPENG